MSSFALRQGPDVRSAIPAGIELRATLSVRNANALKRSIGTNPRPRYPRKTKYMSVPALLTASGKEPMRIASHIKEM